MTKPKADQLRRVRSLAAHGTTLTGEGPKILEAEIVRLTEAEEIHSHFVADQITEILLLRKDKNRAIEIAREALEEINQEHQEENPHDERGEWTCMSCTNPYPCRAKLLALKLETELDAMKEGE